MLHGVTLLLKLLVSSIEFVAAAMQRHVSLQQPTLDMVPDRINLVVL